MKKKIKFYFLIGILILVLNMFLIQALLFFNGIAYMRENASNSKDIIIDKESLVNTELNTLNVGDEEIPFIEFRDISLINYGRKPHERLDKVEYISCKFKNNSSKTISSIRMELLIEDKTNVKLGLYDNISPGEISDTIMSDDYIFKGKNINNLKLSRFSYSMFEDDGTYISVDYYAEDNKYEIRHSEELDKDIDYIKKYRYYPSEERVELYEEYELDVASLRDINCGDFEAKEYSNDYSLNNSSSDSASASNKVYIKSLKYGDLIDVYQDDDLLIIKAKIDFKYSKKSTIEQNSFNIKYLIEDNTLDGINEIQYWAVANRGNGYDEKVVSFTVNKDLINRIRNGYVAGAYIIDEASDVWIHYSLR